MGVIDFLLNWFAKIKGSVSIAMKHTKSIFCHFRVLKILNFKRTMLAHVLKLKNSITISLKFKRRIYTCNLSPATWFVLPYLYLSHLLSAFLLSLHIQLPQSCFEIPTAASLKQHIASKSTSKCSLHWQLTTCNLGLTLQLTQVMTR